MLYLGHFSFDGPEHDGADAADGVQHGYFSALAQADTVDEACGKFRALIPRIGREQEMFEANTHVWLDSCIEVRELPPEGLLAHVVVALGEDGSMSASLVGAPAGVGEAYGWEPDIDDAGAGFAGTDAAWRTVALTGDEDGGDEVGSADEDGADEDSDDEDDEDDGGIMLEPFLVIR